MYNNYSCIIIIIWYFLRYIFRFIVVWRREAARAPSKTETETITLTEKEQYSQTKSQD